MMNGVLPSALALACWLASGTAAPVAADEPPAGGPSCDASWARYFDVNKARVLERGWYGVVAEPSGHQGTGPALVQLVFSGSPGDRAGIEVGDHIVEIEGEEPPGKLEDFTAIWRNRKIGEAVELELVRGSQRKTVRMEAVRPTPPPVLQAYALDLMLQECGPERHAAALHELNQANALARPPASTPPPPQR